MIPLDISRANYTQLAPLLVGMRLATYDAWLKHGPGTTRQIAEKSGIDILTFRPRSTELMQLELLVLEDATQLRTSEGIYRARRITEWQTHVEKIQAPIGNQIQLL